MNKILALMLIAAFAVVAGCAKAPVEEEVVVPTADVQVVVPAAEVEVVVPAVVVPAEETAIVDGEATTEVEVY